MEGLGRQNRAFRLILVSKYTFWGGRENLRKMDAKMDPKNDQNRSQKRSEIRFLRFLAVLGGAEI
mgnify:CR=1 FL=1